MPRTVIGANPAVVDVGDSCLSVVFDEQIAPAINARCVALADLLARQSRPGIRDIVPTFHSVAVYFDPLQVDRAGLRRDLEALAPAAVQPEEASGDPIEIRVSYGGEEGPDLHAVAAFARCTEQDVVRLHAGVVYRVYMMGFLPGFAYLGSLDPRIAMPRLDTPRLRVAAGSVGIAGLQTGIYPCDSPGGWRIIGRTQAKLFDSAAGEPFLLKAGDRVRFVAV
jgi:inhibitor of KinA